MISASSTGGSPLASSLPLIVSAFIESVQEVCVWGPARSNTAAKKYIALIKKKKRKKASLHRKEKRNTSCCQGVVWEASQSAIYKAHGCHICTLAHRKQGDERHSAQKNKTGSSATISQVHQRRLVHCRSLLYFFFLSLFGHIFPPGRHSAGLWLRLIRVQCRSDITDRQGYPLSSHLFHRSGHLLLNWLIFFHCIMFEPRKCKCPMHFNTTVAKQ